MNKLGPANNRNTVFGRVKCEYVNSYGQLWAIMGNYEQLWEIMGNYEQLWSNYGQL